MSVEVSTRPLEDYQVHLDYHASLPGHDKLMRFRHEYMDLFQPPAGASILDLGGYIGATALHYGEQGHEVVSVEGAKAYCDEFQKNAAHLDNVSVIWGLFEDFPTFFDRFDACCCTEVLNQVVDPLAVMEVAWRELRSGGLLFVVVPSKKLRVEKRTFKQGELERLVEEAGFALNWSKHLTTSPTPQWIVEAHK